MHLIHVDDLTLSQRQAYRKLAHDQARAGFAECLNLSIEHVQLMELTPQDFGLSSWRTPPLRVGLNQWISTTIPYDRLFVIYKVTCLSVYPGASALSLGTMAGSLAIYQLSACYSGLPALQSVLTYFEEKDVRDVTARMLDKPIEEDLRIGFRVEGYFTDMVPFRPDSPVVIKVEADRESPGDWIILGGFRAELKGMTVIP